MTVSNKRKVGRPPAKDPATKLVTIKMTPRQHSRFLERGGSRWVKRLLDEMPGSPKEPWNSEK